MRKHHDKIHEALELLNEAAKDKKDELYEIVGDKYSDIKDLLTAKAGNGVAMMDSAKKRFTKGLHTEEKKIASKAHEIERNIRRNPWPYVGAAALGALVFGVFLGKK